MSRKTSSQISFLSSYSLFSSSSPCSALPPLIKITKRYPNLYEVRLIPTKRDIAFVEYMDETSSTVAKDALHNYKLDGENKIKVYTLLSHYYGAVWLMLIWCFRSHLPGNKHECCRCSLGACSCSCNAYLRVAKLLECICSGFGKIR
jgi:hypothetical protein